MDCTGFSPLPVVNGQINVAPNLCGPTCCTGTVNATLFASNYFTLYVNGNFIKSDPVAVSPLQSVTIFFTPSTNGTTTEYAVWLQDSLDNTITSIGTFLASFTDGTVTGGNWKCQVVERGPPMSTLPYDANWFASGYNFSSWLNATSYSTVPISSAAIYNASTALCGTVYTTAEECVPAPLNPPPLFPNGSQPIWSANSALDNEILCRYNNTSPIQQVKLSEQIVLARHSQLIDRHPSILHTIAPYVQHRVE
jgi:hypothetical protein